LAIAVGPQRPSKWPAAIPERINRIVNEGPWLYDLWEASPVRFIDEHSQAEEIISVLFPGNPLLCCGRSCSLFDTRRRESWGNSLSLLPLIVPNPMHSETGRRKSDGATSKHTLEATARRVSLVVEFDFSRYARDGKTLSQWAQLVDQWENESITVADACAALHFHLSKRLPLVVATHSGGKSLHGFRAQH
jgi:hypothetical protein